MKPALIITIVIIILLGVVSGIYYYALTHGDEAIACTEDARLCDDGVTSVARSPPDCEFDPCPNKECSINSDCVVFGETGECNCGCYNKDFLPQNSGGECFCQAPTSCKCITNKCEGIFE